MVPFNVWQKLWDVGYPQTIVVIIEDGVAIILHNIGEH